MSGYTGQFSITPRYSGYLDMEYLYIENHNEVKIEKLREDAFGGTYLNNATVEMTLFDTSGVTVSGQTFPSSLSYATNSPGTYEGALKANQMTLSEGAEFDLEVTVDSGGAQVSRWFRRLIAVQRRG